MTVTAGSRVYRRQDRFGHALPMSTDYKEAAGATALCGAKPPDGGWRDWASAGIALAWPPYCPECKQLAVKEAVGRPL